MPGTKQPDYDVSPNFGTLVEKHKQLSLKRFMDVIRSKIEDINDILQRSAPYDQGPGRVIPYAIPVWFGPLPLTTARRALTANAAAGFEVSATLADPAKYVVPLDGPVVIDREMSFRVKSMAAYGFVNFGYTADPGFSVPYTNPNGVGDILDPVGDDPSLGPNGGAMPLDFFGGTFSTISTPQPNLPNISFDVEIYDRLRGRRLHDNKLPSNLFQGGRIAHRPMMAPMTWEKGAKIEPRLFVNEIRMGSILDTTQAFDAASVKAWVCLVFKGEQYIEVPNV